jgi:hypothetical protein
MYIADFMMFRMMVHKEMLGATMNVSPYTPPRQAQSKPQPAPDSVTAATPSHPPTPFRAAIRSKAKQG